jgi:bis(5'-nucleosyl)-tetraphosphatase (symmetrical)
LVHRDADWVLVHAGVPAFWTVDEALARAKEVEDRLRSDREAVLAVLYGGETPSADSPDHDEASRLRMTVGALTRMRACASDGTLDFDFAGSLGQMPPGLRPWFEVPSPPRGERVLFGHWAALGHHSGPGFVSLDTGCVWGGKLTAYRLEDGAVFDVPKVD